jgi:hypothetical protein
MPHFVGRQLWLRAGVLLVLILAAIAAYTDSELSLILLVAFVVVELVELLIRRETAGRVVHFLTVEQIDGLRQIRDHDGVVIAVRRLRQLSPNMALLDSIGLVRHL